MADVLLVTILTYLHVILAMGWLGGAVLFLSVIAPGLRSLGPAASLEFLAKVGPRATWFFIGAATSTVIFGPALFFTLAGDFPATHGIYIGIILGLIAYLVGMIVTVPSLRQTASPMK
jgi:Na+(H+)/acetate symporter ActP